MFFQFRFPADSIRAPIFGSNNTLLELIGNSIDRLLGRWNHLFVVYDGSSKAKGVTVYLDGRVVGCYINNDNLSGSMPNTGPLLVGLLKGRIDDLRIYDRQLEKHEIVALYESGRRMLARVDASKRDEDQSALLTTARRSMPIDEQDMAKSPEESGLRGQWQNEWERARRWYINSKKRPSR